MQNKQNKQAIHNTNRKQPTTNPNDSQYGKGKELSSMLVTYLCHPPRL